jgi:hypothetical protein
MAEITVKAETAEFRDWDWGSVKDLGVEVEYSIQYHRSDLSTINLRKSGRP